MRYLPILVFTTGAVTLGMELSASRLIEPAFGSNQIVWAALIGLILLYLALGAWLGGHLADRFPEQRYLDYTLTAGALGVAIVPSLSPAVLRLAAQGLEGLVAGQLAGALIAILLLFSVPTILLGTASPWAIRLEMQEIASSGNLAGRYYAIATAGSLVGTFLPVLWLIPSYGTRWTFYLLALTLATVLTCGSIRHPHRWVPLLGLALVAALSILTEPGAAIRGSWDSAGSGKIVYEDESAYNYIAVREWGNERHLKLNDGVGIHSVYHPDAVLSQGIWDYFLLGLLFRDTLPDPETDSVLLIGLAAGTVSALITDIYGPVPIVGVELDPQIIEVGKRYFEMDQTNLTAIAADGRRWLQQQPEEARWSMIAVDAYRPPYIPFHLATEEFFTLVHQHLTEDGVLAINVGRTADNFALVDALVATLQDTYASIYVIDEPGPADTLANSMVIATVAPVDPDLFDRQRALLPTSVPLEFRDFAAGVTELLRHPEPPDGTPRFTDDKAPVERVVHAIIVDFLTRPH